MPQKPTRYTEELIENYFENKYWTSDTTTSLWNHNAAVYPEDEAYVEKNRRFTWLEVNIMSNIIADILIDTGFRSDDLLFMLLPNIVESYALRVACEKRGILCCTALMTLGEVEINYIMERYHPVGIVTPLQYRSMNYYNYIEKSKDRLSFLKYVLYLDKEVPEGSHSLREKVLAAHNKSIFSLYHSKFDPTETSVIAFTSGTTGMPKAVEHAQCGRMALARAYGFNQFILSKKDVVLNVVSAVAGLGASFCYNGSTALVGAKSVILDKWNEQDALELIQRERVSVLLAVPAQLAQLVKRNDLSKYDLSSLRVVSSSTAALSSDLAKQVEKTFGVPVVNTYGQFDGGIIAQTTIRDSPDVRYNTVGKPPTGMVVKLIDKGVESNEGEIVYSGPTTVGGYYQDYEATINAWGSLGLNGMFRSGDLGRFDNDGNLMIVGRIKNVIIRGGQNIYPAEIEGLLVMYPKIKEVVVIPMKDEIMGEKVCAYVSTFDGTGISLEEVIQYLGTKNIAKYKYPERLEVMKELPKIGAQKIDVKKLVIDLNEKLSKNH